ncbi:MAG: acyl-CoA thioesterase [Candidatus Binatota bacterium]|nr:acyl-CoA thioesterase [Candidatus Binatota bacterium]
MRNLGWSIASCLLLIPLVTSCGGGGGDGSRLSDVNQDGTIHVLAFGDSITRGVGDGPEETSEPSLGSAGYPARLELTSGVLVTNGGQPGEETERGVQRLPSLLAGLVPRADHVILLEGANDLLNGVDPATVVNNLRTLASQTMEAGAEPFFATLTPICCDHAHVVPTATVNDLNQRILAAGQQSGIFVIDFFAALDGAMFTPASGLLHSPEGLHPTPAGYDRMAAFAADALG